MKAYNGFEAKKAAGVRDVLPAGGYLAKIMKAEEKHYDWGNVLIIYFDIAEGEYNEFFTKDFRNQTQEDKKWRGTLRLTIPKNDGSEKDQWSKNAFENAIWSLEESNPGYHFDWDETKFKGKMVGVLYRNKQWELNGNTGWTTECCSLIDIDSIRKKTFKTPKDKPLKAGSASSTQPMPFGFDSLDVSYNEGDLPF